MHMQVPAGLLILFLYESLWFIPLRKYKGPIEFWSRKQNIEVLKINSRFIKCFWFQSVTGVALISDPPPTPSRNKLKHFSPFWKSASTKKIKIARIERKVFFSILVVLESNFCFCFSAVRKKEEELEASLNRWGIYYIIKYDLCIK